jgi:tetratricopeptide (TPR) repeat protein
MTVERKIYLVFFLLIIINFTFQPALAQINETVIEPVNDTIIANEIFQHKNEIIILNATFSDSSQKNGLEEIYMEPQNSFDESLSILNLVGTLMAVLVGLITLIIVIAIACGIFEYRKWKAIRNNIQIEANLIGKIRQNVENDAESIRKKIAEYPLMLSTDIPSKEVMENLDKLSSKLELIELLGVALKPEDFLNQGKDLFYKEEYDSSLSIIDKGIKLHPDINYLWTARCDILHKLGRYQEGLESIEKSIYLNPNAHETWNKKGIFLHKIGRYDEALIAYEKSLALRPEYPSTLYNLACLYSIKEDKEKMLVYLEKAIAKDPIYKEKAKKDTDFEKFLNNIDFKNLIE